jgi:hypothetical protein
MEPFSLPYVATATAVNQIAKERKLNSLEQAEHIYVLSGSTNFACFATFGAKLIK